MEIKIYTLEITFTQPILGTQPHKDVAMDHLRKKAQDKGADILPDEQETLSEMVEKATTVFHKDEGKPVYFDYHIKGFLKESGRIQNPIGNLKNVRGKVNDYVFVTPRMIELILPENAEIAYLERPIRAMTAQGPRVSVIRSEMLPVGTKLICEIKLLNEVISENVLRKILDYGQFCGLGQWRNGSYGRFEYVLAER